MLITLVGTLAIAAILTMLVAMVGYAAATMRAGRPVTRLGAEGYERDQDRRAGTDPVVT